MEALRVGLDGSARAASPTEHGRAVAQDQAPEGTDSDPRTRKPAVRLPIPQHLALHRDVACKLPPVGRRGIRGCGIDDRHGEDAAGGGLQGDLAQRRGEGREQLLRELRRGVSAQPRSS